MTGHFRYSVWDPLLIGSQILTIQCLYYTSLGILIFVADSISGHTASLTHMFSYSEITLQTGHGRFVLSCYILNALCGSFYLWYFVQRAKPCLDFSATIHIIHLIGSWIYNGYFPNTFSWWILNIICMALMCVCGEFLCMKTELRDIPLITNRNLQKSDV